MRIIAGDKRGKKLEPPEDETIRPTSDKVRGAIYNILAHASWAPVLFKEEQAVLDVFCGTGACGLEALSRGMGKGCFIDSAIPSLQLAKRNAISMGYKDRCIFTQSDALQLSASMQPYELVFLDPPYRKELAAPTLVHLAKKGWLAHGAVVIVECAKAEQIATPESFNKMDERRYGDTQALFMIYQ